MVSVRVRTPITVLIALLTSLSLVTRAQQRVARQSLSLEWIYGEEGHLVTALPSFAWLRDGSILLYDQREPLASRAFERMLPPAGTRQRLASHAAALASLKALAPRLKETELPWPAAVDPDGRRAFFAFDDDVFVLDLVTATFKRLTTSTDPETCLGLSPDGTRLAFVRRHDLYIIDLASGAERRLTHDGSATTLNGTLSWVYWEEIFGRKDEGWWWSPDGTTIAYLQTDEAPVAVSHFVDFQPATPRVLEQRYPKAGSANPTVRVGLVKVTGGATTWVSITDKPFEYVLRVKWLPDSRRISVQTLTRDQQELGLYIAEGSSGRATRILTDTDPGWINVSDDLRFLSDGKQFLWASERDGYLHLYRYAIDGQLVNRITKGPWALASADASAYWVRQAVAGVDEARGWIYFVSLQQSSVERQLYRVHPDGTGWSRVSTEPGSHSISMSPDTTFYVDTFSDIRTLPRVTIRRTDGSIAAEISAAPMERVKAFDLTSPELTTIPTRDGFPMPAQILKPRGRTGTRHPVVMFVYGGPSAPTVKNAWQNSALHDQLLADAGFVLVEVDNRCATGISKTLENTILRRSGEPETADLVDAARWIKQQPWADPARIGVWGWSGGGTMTLNLLTRSTEFMAGVAVAPVTDWHFYDTKWVEAFMKRPEENPAGYEQFNLVARAPALHGRLLLMFGTDDDNVHPQNAEAFIDALVKAGITFETSIYPMRKHGISDDAARIHLFKTMIEFWKRNL
jgi:dipeptidyl-peptidase 4